MTTTVKVLIGISSTAAIGAIIYFGFIKKAKTVTPGGDKPSGGGGSGGGGGVPKLGGLPAATAPIPQTKAQIKAAQAAVQQATIKVATLPGRATPIAYVPPVADPIRVATKAPAPTTVSRGANGSVSWIDY